MKDGRNIPLGFWFKSANEMSWTKAIPESLCRIWT
jgi:hypothetical protein